MVRGRPRKDSVPATEGSKDLLSQIAEVVHLYCGIPGCSSKYHIEEAEKILRLVKVNYGLGE